MDCAAADFDRRSPGGALMGGPPDPQVLAALLALREDAPDVPPPAVGDVMTRRRNAGHMFNQVLASRPPITGVVTQEFSVDHDGTAIGLRWYRRTGADQPGSAALYLHGGGMILDWERLGGLYDAVVRGYVAASGVPMLVVDYRVAPEFPHPVPLQDCYAALRWLTGHADELGVDASRLAVMGDSAGGGLATGVCLLARDRGGPSIAAQLLIYPMLDDRTGDGGSADGALLTWSYDDNATGWSALLAGGAADGYAAPARADDLTGLPPAYLDVGGLDIFAREDVRYAQRLLAAGVPVELHVYPGCPHAFDLLAPDTDVSQRVIADRVRYLASL
ncbi:MULTISPECIES: alpha/beta hydrolase [Mycobacteriaceae]|uniref:Lipase LipI n=4 Tax=Mycobacteriaceae TaxID=1762 RepID=F5YZ90_MYCSD|nr:MULTISPECIES: alpha/beta hydrolase [Mycobacteriaceae]AEF36753.1 lipase LipI [Mycolicibacter sinensis]BBX14213.1 alpha/beta hydrolase [Mycobacterium novum]GFG85864.1 alpha/beta hydrolase [Mycolicibacter algericus]